MNSPAQTSPGATPNGAIDEEQAANWVQDMFARVAPTYDLLNHLLSFRIDRGWRKVLTRSLRDVLLRSDARVLDLCCGTGDVLLDFQHISRATLLGVDFCHPMLEAAQKKLRRNGRTSSLLEADALHLPFADESLDAISIAFGFRNLANYRAGLSELYRVLKPSGTLAILEFSHPPGTFVKAAYGFYSARLLPLVGRLISGSADAYSYLPESIRKFPTAERLCEMMTNAGFDAPNYQLLSGGIAALHLATRPLCA